MHASKENGSKEECTRTPEENGSKEECAHAQRARRSCIKDKGPYEIAIPAAAVQDKG